MATTILFSLASITELHAVVSELSVDEGKITARYSDYPLRKGLKELAEQSGITFLIDPDVDGRLNFRMEKAPLTLGIRRLLSKYNHVIMQGKDKEGHLMPKLVRILRKGEYTAARFDVIKGGEGKPPSGGYQNYRKLLSSGVRPGRMTPPPGMSPALRGTKMAQLRARATELRHKIRANQKRTGVLKSVAAQSRVSQGKNSTSGLRVSSIAEMAKKEDQIENNGQEKSPSDQYYLKNELRETLKQINEIIAISSAVDTPANEAIDAELAQERLSQASRKANTHNKPKGDQIIINLFPGKGEKVIQ